MAKKIFGHFSFSKEINNMGRKFICPKCGNEDIRKIGYLNGEPYCRACIRFTGPLANIEPSKTISFINNKRGEYSLSYQLSNDQFRISNMILNCYLSGVEALIYAVCGAGKTEIVYETISYVLRNGGKVGFAIPRRDVVIEIYQRLKEVFKHDKLTSVYGGHTEHLDGDLICLTTHQLFRFQKYFDLLIVDEIDAFPYSGDEVLEAFVKTSYTKGLVMMSATPSKKVKSYFSKEGRTILYLNTRFHEHPLPVPIVVKKSIGVRELYIIKKLKSFINENKPVFIFVPTISIGENLNLIISKVVPNGRLVHSKCKDREEIISNFKSGRYKYLITTAVLERGVTVKNLQVIIFMADHEIYDEHALVQISGRVGRKKDAPEGEVIFIVRHESQAIRKCIREIKAANSHL